MKSNKFQAYIYAKFPDGIAVGSNGLEWKTMCPKCLNDKNKFYISMETGAAFCHHCNYKTGEMFALIRDLEGLASTYHAEQWLKQNKNFLSFAYDVPRTFRIKNYMQKQLPETFHPLPDKESGKAYMEYLYKRKLTDAQISLFKIGYCGSGKYQGRVIIPVISHGELEYFVDRAINEDAVKQGQYPKILGVGTHNEAWPVPKSSVIWNEEALDASLNTHDLVIICEGVFSAFAAASELNAPACATLGKDMSDVQLMKFVHSEISSFIVYYDAGAEAESYRAAHKLWKWGKDVSMAFLKTGDPAEHDAPPTIVKFGAQQELEGVMKGFLVLGDGQEVRMK